MAVTARTEIRSGRHHQLPAHEVLLMLGTDPERGLSTREALSRAVTYGPNQLPAARGPSLLVRAARQVHNPLVYVLLASAAVTALLRSFVDTAVIVGVVLVNAIIGFLQESRAEAALDALRSMAAVRARVVRDGVAQSVDAVQLVPGDVVLVEAGDKIPADLRLVRVHGLRVDESTLTGESVPVTKSGEALPDETAVPDRLNMAYAGTLVTGGSGSAVTVATGAATELGEIHRLVGSARTLATPLTRKLARFSRLLTVLILALAAGTFAVGLARGGEVAQTFTAAVALAVGAIPEGLPAAVTITLAIGVGRMARRQAIVRRLPAVETLGSTTVICSDKTGTLTENRMRVQRLWTAGGEIEVTAEGQDAGGLRRGGQRVEPAADAAVRWTLLVGVLCSDAEPGGPGDPTELALCDVAGEVGLDPVQLRADERRVAVLPFSAERFYMATRHVGDGRHLLVKGAVERVLGLCSEQLDAAGTRRRLSPAASAAVLAAAEDLAARGLRVLATAVKVEAGDAVGAIDEISDLDLTGMAFAGLQAMLDPPRESAVAAVRACRDAGISVKMITGDHPATAAAIARQVGCLPEGAPPDAVRTGAELAGTPPERLPEIVERAAVLARVSPEQKLRLVRALQRRGHVVAMTGDGVNDAPALRQADIGVAMGHAGTEVAKEAADIVLVDDHFATIKAAVEEGRAVFDNLTKFIVWTLPTNVGEGLVILVAIALGTALPILPTQILWINMTTAVALGLMLAFEPKEPGLMTRPPRDPARPLLTLALGVRVLMVSAILLAASWWLFEAELNRGAPIADARTAALNLFVAVEVVYLFSCRSLQRSVRHLGWFSNRWVIGGVAVQVALQAALTYLPFLNSMFGTAPIDAQAWLRIALVAAAAGVVVAVDKRLWRRRL